MTTETLIKAKELYELKQRLSGVISELVNSKIVGVEFEPYPTKYDWPKLTMQQWPNITNLCFMQSGCDDIKVFILNVLKEKLIKVEAEISDLKC